jgi:hypothetical protein
VNQDVHKDVLKDAAKNDQEDAAAVIKQHSPFKKRAV